MSQKNLNLPLEIFMSVYSVKVLHSCDSVCHHLKGNVMIEVVVTF